MGKVGVSIKVDVTKLDKSKFFKGQKGIYANMVCFIDLDDADQYGNNGGVQQEKDKNSEEQMPYIGNVKIFWRENQAGSQNSDQNEEDIPF